MTATLVFDEVETPGADLEMRGRRLAGGLCSMGLREGSVVAVLLRNDPAYVDVILACRTGGFFYCPLNWHFTAAEIAYIVADSGAEAVIGHDDLLRMAREVLPANVSVIPVGPPDMVARPYEAWLAGQTVYDGPPATPRGHMAYTSGTTGRPKGVVRLVGPVADADGATRRGLTVAELAFGIRAGCRALIPAPLYHSAPSAYAQGAVQVAERLVIQRRFDAEEVLAAIDRHRIDAVYLVPIMYSRLLALPAAVRSRYDVSTLRFVASTGAPCAPEVKAAMINWFGPVVHETYGSSEAGMVTIATSADALAKPGTAGLPIGAGEVRIHAPDGRLCAPGEAGLVYVRQPLFADFTYRNQPEAREAVGRDDLVTLGDIGYLDRDGHLFLCDRAADMVISGGVNIYPAEVESVLMGLPGVRDCAVFGIPDAEFGERLIAQVEPEPGASPEPDGLRQALGRTLASYKLPKRIEIVTALPRDDSGKIAKRRLREPYWLAQERRI